MQVEPTIYSMIQRVPKNVFLIQTVHPLLLQICQNISLPFLYLVEVLIIILLTFMKPDIRRFILTILCHFVKLGNPLNHISIIILSFCIEFVFEGFDVEGEREAKILQVNQVG